MISDCHSKDLSFKYARQAGPIQFSSKWRPNIWRLVFDMRPAPEAPRKVTAASARIVSMYRSDPKCQKPTAVRILWLRTGQETVVPYDLAKIEYESLLISYFENRINPHLKNSKLKGIIDYDSTVSAIQELPVCLTFRDPNSKTAKHTSAQSLKKPSAKKIRVYKRNVKNSHQPDEDIVFSTKAKGASDSDQQ